MVKETSKTADAHVSICLIIDTVLIEKKKNNLASSINILLESFSQSISEMDNIQKMVIIMIYIFTLKLKISSILKKAMT